MLNLESNYFNEYYGNNPQFYNIAFMHYNLEKFTEDNSEYLLIEKDLVKLKEYINELFKIYFSSIDDLLMFNSNTSIVDNYFEDIYLRINGVEDFNKLKDINMDGMKIIIPYSKLNNYDREILNSYKIVLQIDNVSELSLDDLNNLSLYSVSEIIVGQICYLSSYFMPYFERIGEKFNIDPMNQLCIEKQALISNDNYSLEDYSIVYNELKNIVDGIDFELDDVSKFKVIYERIINKINYDFDGVETTKLSNQNLLGGLVNNSCVCEGFAKILQQALSLVGIESIVVGGNGEKEDGGHIWNQVKIDGVWYNADAAYDSIEVRKGNEMSLCLVDDSSVYKTDYLIANKCDKKYVFGSSK